MTKKPRKVLNIAPARFTWCDRHQESHWHITALQHVASDFRCQTCGDRADVVRRADETQQLCWAHHAAMLELEA